MRRQQLHWWDWVLLAAVILGSLWFVGCATTAPTAPPLQINMVCVTATLAQMSPTLTETVLTCMQDVPLADKQAAQARCVTQAMASSSALALTLLPCLAPPGGQ